jgi:hypothetical protein
MRAAVVKAIAGIVALPRRGGKLSRLTNPDTQNLIYDLQHVNIVTTIHAGGFTDAGVGENQKRARQGQVKLLEFYVQLRIWWKGNYPRGFIHQQFIHQYQHATAL